MSLVTPRGRVPSGCPIESISQVQSELTSERLAQSFRLTPGDVQGPLGHTAPELAPSAPISYEAVSATIKRLIWALRVWKPQLQEKD